MIFKTLLLFNFYVSLMMMITLFEGSSGELNVTRINKGDLYVYQDGAYNGIFMVTPKGVIVVDSPPSSNSDGMSILESIEKVTSKDIKWVIYTHHHLDHVGSMGIFPKDAEYICHKEAADAIKKEGLPKCTIKVGDSYDLKIDEDHLIQLRYNGPVHSSGNLYVYVPKYKLLMLADLAYPQWGPYASLGMQNSLFIYDQHFDIALGYDFQYYVGGHVDRIGSRDDVKQGKQFWKDLVSVTKEAIDTIDKNQVIEDNGGLDGTNTWTIYNAYSKAIEDYCVDHMLNELGWSEKLIDVEVFMGKHCFITYEYVVVNY